MSSAMTNNPRTSADVSRRPRRSFAVLVALVATLVVCAGITLVPSAALAKSYSITKVDIDATVGTDGSLTVVEDRTFDFDGDFHGVYWDIPEGSYEGRTVSVAVGQVGEVVDGQLTPFSTQGYGSSGSYSVSETTSDSGTFVQQVKLYSTKSDTTATYRISYVLTGGVSAWSDTGELYWKFVTDGWDVPSEDVTCTVHLPVASGETVTAGDNVRVWAHGPVNGESTVTSDGATFTVPEVGTDEYAEARITFPVSWLSQMTPSSTAKLDSIMSEEQAWTDEANAKREQARNTVRGLTVGGFALAAVSAVLVFLARRRYGIDHKAHFSDDYFRDVPTSDHPAVLGCLLHDGDVGSADFTASLMRLTDEGAIGLDLVTTTKDRLIGKKVEEDYRITRNPDVAATLTDPVDKDVMAFLFGDVAPRVAGYEPAADGRETLMFSDVQRVAKSQAQAYSDSLDSWKERVQATCERRGFFVDAKGTKKGALIILGGVDVIACVAGLLVTLIMVGMDAALLVAILALGAVGVVSFVVAAGMRELSDEAIETRAKLLALRRWLCEFTRLKEAVPSDVVLWNKLLVMSVVLGVSDKVIEQLKVAMPEMLEDPAFMPTYGWCMYYGGMPCPMDAFSRAYDTSAQVSTAALAASSNSSGGGFGGGFSGGGGGGFGGGGGGGAF